MSVESAEDFMARGNNFFVDENFEAALAAYSSAIELETDNAELYVKRASCHKQLKNFAACITDCNKAIQLNPKHHQAYFFKGVAAFNEEEYETAKAAFEKGVEFATNPAQFKTWIRKCQAELDAENEHEAEAPKPKPQETPKPAPAPAPAPAPVATASAAATTAPSSAPKVRHEWFQTESHVTVSVYIKNVKKEDATIDISEQNLSVTVKLPGQNNEFVFDINLADKVIKNESSFEILSTKIEIKLKKERAGRWKTLENTGENAVGTWGNVQGASDSNAAKLYPSSKGSKDWDKVVPKLEEDKLEGDAALNKVFRDIYGGASEDQRRAMMKSFYESGGTVLSTNWDEVGKGTVKGSPPDGMEMKKWTDGKFK